MREKREIVKKKTQNLRKSPKKFLKTQEAVVCETYELLKQLSVGLCGLRKQQDIIYVDEGLVKNGAVYPGHGFLK